jgi:hypothetical protein
MSRTRRRLVVCIIAALGLLALPAAAHAALPDPTVHATTDVSPPGPPNGQVITSDDCKLDGSATMTIHGGGTFNGTSGDDYIEVANDAPGSQTIYGHGGDDVIYANDGADHVYGGPGRDYLMGDDGDDVVVGDNFDDSQHVGGATGQDCLVGGHGDDTVVGDNKGFNRGAEGGSDDILLGAADNDTLVGDSFTSGSASPNDHTATGYGNDWLAGSDNQDKVVGDDFASGPGNIAVGSPNPALGNDSVNLGPDPDTGVGDSWGDNGADASGSSSDDQQADIWPGEVHSKQGGIHLQNGDDAGFGDNWATGPIGPGTTSGGGNDDLGGYDGADTLRGGPGNDSLRGDSNDDCVHRDDENATCTDTDAPRGPAWNDTIYGGPNRDNLYGVWGNNDQCFGGGLTLADDFFDPTCETKSP